MLIVLIMRVVPVIWVAVVVCVALYECYALLLGFMDFGFCNGYYNLKFCHPVKCQATCLCLLKVKQNSPNGYIGFLFLHF